ncbi:MAG: nucleoside triphosphate pyrophosphohydrolase [Pseudomonadota bacterium]|nr:nucleoside triphosphate pyrophosphohydrolase [Pseudomonadota bacterium]
MSKLTEEINNLLQTFKKLRDPSQGCPWDKEQDFKSIASCSIEEAYEVADAIEREDFNDLKEELGDLFFQIIFHSGMAEEKKLFNFEEVVKELNDKLIRRHPHVFDKKQEMSASESLEIWEKEKKKEREKKNLISLMDDIPKNLPSLTRAKKIQKRAKSVGFDWQNENDVIRKIDEEIDELKRAKVSQKKEDISEEIGDLFFTLVNLSRHYNLEPEDIIRKANLKFETRFRKMEDEANKTKVNLEDLEINELETLWQKIK